MMGIPSKRKGCPGCLCVPSFFAKAAQKVNNNIMKAFLAFRSTIILKQIRNNYGVAMYILSDGQVLLPVASPTNADGSGKAASAAGLSGIQTSVR